MVNDYGRNHTNTVRGNDVAAKIVMVMFGDNDEDDDGT